MNSDCPSPSAYGAALYRAAHQLLDFPRIFEDPFALQIIGTEGRLKLKSNIRKYQTEFANYLRAFIVMRSRYAEDLLYKSMLNGVCQYVILGAGLDTFPYRNSFSKSILHVFEVDHPAMQIWKMKQVLKEEMPLSNSLTFFPIDFEAQAISELLNISEFKIAKPTFFSWLGVTQYLSRDKVMEILRFIVSTMPKNSEIVFEYILHPSLLNPTLRIDLDETKKKAAANGEAWRTFFDPKLLATDLYCLGYQHIEDFGPIEANERYFQDRTDGLHVGGVAHLMMARI